MFISKFWNKKIVRDKFFKPLVSLENEIVSIRSKSDTIAICPNATGSSWQGVLTATLGLFGGYTLVLPQYYSQTPYTDKELKEIARIIQSKKFKSIVFSGFPPYFETVISSISEYGQDRLFLLYHGSLSSNREDSYTISMLEQILSLARSRKIHSLGFVKKGMAETFESLWGLDARHIILRTSDIHTPLSTPKGGGDEINIGVFTHDQYRKNIDNQVAAALMIENSIVHLKRNFDFGYLGNSEKLHYHGHFDSYEAFLGVLGLMDVNLYVSFSECWGQIITESLALGVPCLAAENSGVFDFDSELGKLLIVKEFDNSAAIAEQIKRVLPFKEEIGRKGREYVLKLNKMADERLAEWLND